MTALGQRSDADRARAIGKLCVAADWACAHGDLLLLRSIADRLASYTEGPLRYELVSFAERCLGDPVGVGAAWDRLKVQISRSGEA